MAQGSARYARENGTWFIKLGGDLRHTLAPALNTLLDRAFADPGFEQVALDLSDAENIDSTCLGILARIGNQARRDGKPRPVIISDNEDISELLLAVCFDRLFNLVDAAGPFDDSLQPVPAAQADSERMLKLVLEAHRRLCDIDKRNNAVFCDVVSALENEARRKSSE